MAPIVDWRGRVTIYCGSTAEAGFSTQYIDRRIAGAGCNSRGRRVVMGWTDERVEILKKLWLEGLSASQIAKQLGGVTRNAVIGKVHRLGLSGRAEPPRPRRAAPKTPRTVRGPQ